MNLLTRDGLEGAQVWYWLIRPFANSIFAGDKCRPEISHLGPVRSHESRRPSRQYAIAVARLYCGIRQYGCHCERLSHWKTFTLVSL